ncbi:MAG TPA: hypothetical protein VFP69_15685 [Streptomyces sp.]|nr:hypothetical protein [Streptomyces sp.]
MQTLVRPGVSARTLLGEDEFAAVVATVARDSADLTEARAARIVDEALAFVAFCSAQCNGRLRPSLAVDTGWRALILRTDTYHGLCARLGAFVHRWPDPPGLTEALRDPLRRRRALHRTQGLLVGAGHEPDPLLWRQIADCVGGTE